MAATQKLFLEINLISAQDLKKPPSPSSALRRGGGLRAYASVSLPGFPKLRTRVDRVGVSNPTWNDRFVFLLPSPLLLLPDSPSALSVDIASRAPSWLLPDSPLGSARILLANLRLLDRPRDAPSFSAFGIRRPSGRFRGVLNVGFTLLSRVSARTAEALARGGANAVGYRDLMGGSRDCHQHPPRGLLKEINHCRPTTSMATATDFSKKEEEEEEEGMQLCGFGGMKRRINIHVSASDENLQHLSWPDSDRRGNSSS